MGLTGFYRVFQRFRMGFPGLKPSLTGLYTSLNGIEWVWLGLTEFDWVINDFLWMLLDLTQFWMGCQRVRIDINGFYWVLLDFT